VRQSILAKPIAQTQSGFTAGTGVVVDGNSNTSTGAVSVNLNNLTMRINTSCTVGLVGSAGQSLSAGILTAKFTKSRATMYVSSVDRKPLSSSRRMILAHLTDVQNSGATFSGQERGKLTSWGSLPHLVKLGTAEVTIRFQRPADIRVYRMDLSGRRTSLVPTTVVSGAIKFNVSTNDPSTNQGVLYYELVSTK
jgi:hypothetical protein